MNKTTTIHVELAGGGGRPRKGPTNLSLSLFSIVQPTVITLSPTNLKSSFIKSAVHIIENVCHIGTNLESSHYITWLF